MDDDVVVEARLRESDDARRRDRARARRRTRSRACPASVVSTSFPPCGALVSFATGAPEAGALHADFVLAERAERLGRALAHRDVRIRTSAVAASFAPVRVERRGRVDEARARLDASSGHLNASAAASAFAITGGDFLRGIRGRRRRVRIERRVAFFRARAPARDRGARRGPPPPSRRRPAASSRERVRERAEPDVAELRVAPTASSASSRTRRCSVFVSASHAVRRSPTSGRRKSAARRARLPRLAVRRVAPVDRLRVVRALRQERRRRATQLGEPPRERRWRCTGGRNAIIAERTLFATGWRRLPERAEPTTSSPYTSPPSRQHGEGILRIRNDLRERIRGRDATGIAELRERAHRVDALGPREIRRRGDARKLGDRAIARLRERAHGEDARVRLRARERFLRGLEQARGERIVEPLGARERIERASRRRRPLRRGAP